MVRKILLFGVYSPHLEGIMLYLLQLYVTGALCFSLNLFFGHFWKGVQWLNESWFLSEFQAVTLESCSPKSTGKVFKRPYYSIWIQYKIQNTVAGADVENLVLMQWTFKPGVVFFIIKCEASPGSVCIWSKEFSSVSLLHWYTFLLLLIPKIPFKWMYIQSLKQRDKGGLQTAVKFNTSEKVSRAKNLQR